MDAQKLRIMKHALSEKMSRLAEIRKCPKCLRKNAISTQKDHDWIYRKCRYCDWEEGKYIEM